MSRRKIARTPSDGHSSSGQKVEELSSDPPSAKKETMTAIFIERAGGPGALVRREVNCPKLPLAHDEVLIRVAAIGVNRLDLHQRKVGHGAPNFCPGIECSGLIEAVGKKVDRLKPGGKVGDRVCAILDSGGYAEKVVVPISQVLPVPSNVSLLEAACLPVAACCAWKALSKANVGKGKTILIYESCGDIAVFAIQMAKHMGAKVFAAADSVIKQNFYKELGADKCFNYRNAEFFAELKALGVNAILDGWAANFKDNLKSLDLRGVLVYVDLHHYTFQEINIRMVMAKHAKFLTVNVFRDLEAIKQVKTQVWPAIEAGVVKPVVHERFPLSQAAAAHSFMIGEHWTEKLISSLGSWTSYIQKFYYTTLAAGYLRGKVLLSPDGYGEKDLLAKENLLA